MGEGRRWWVRAGLHAARTMEQQVPKYACMKQDLVPDLHQHDLK